MSSIIDFQLLNSIPIIIGFLIIYILVWSHFRPPLGHTQQLSFKSEKEAVVFLMGAIVGVLTIITIFYRL